MRARLLAAVAPVAASLALILGAGPLAAADHVLRAETVADMKAVYGQVLSRDVVAARARISGEVVALDVEEGDDLAAGARVGLVVDDKLALRIEAVQAQLAALAAEAENARDELARAESLLERGVTTRQRVDALRTALDVVQGRIASAEAERAVIAQQGAEGEVLAPASGRVIDAPLPAGAVVMAGEPLARIASGGFFLRLALPERHAALLSPGMEVLVEGRPADPAGSRAATGRVARVLPALEAGRVLVDVEADGLDGYLVGERTLVRLPVATRTALRAPEAAVVTRGGVDFVALRGPDGVREVAVLTGAREGGMVEILAGLRDGDVAVAP
ncbi:MAG: efflux RND transporter periplasmic adaptor subunit [Rubrimonas sp.]|uniref:efflux RND transporter periplasmic adaptor subunit n=1 Tax=Rubrimonas sp. TaxID=2036015 RepID=UPI002FDDA1D9